MLFMLGLRLMIDLLRETVCLGGMLVPKALASSAKVISSHAIIFTLHVVSWHNYGVLWPENYLLNVTQRIEIIFLSFWWILYEIKFNSSYYHSPYIFLEETQ